ncbi:uncharacterized protein LOC131299773 [Rhododendron vialii]|uniref:uncharacterized protein LOC131299773 n=1 Tax=Rhododendron vialii TaxID=182163 RepID=UPI00265FA5E5|nr:uncharacterized protein LOC131299773 [Rhododendron vialii]
MERGMRDFVAFCNSMELFDIPMIGRKYTWTNYQDHAILSRLDIFLLSQQWLDSFKVLQWGLHRPISDHCPILLIDDGRDWGPRPFKFMDIWLSNPRCIAIAKETWENTQVGGWAGHIILQKFRAIRNKLKVWNKEEFGDINTALQKKETELHQFDLVVEERELSTEEKALRCKAKTDFWRISRLAETMWRQKSRLNWMKLGDKNTRYFQAIANNRFRRNMVGSVLVNGRVLEEPLEIKAAAVEHFSNNFQEERRIRAVLEIFFEEGEILAAVKDCGSLKASGPDGFNFSFVKKGWGFMKDLVLQFFTEFHANCRLARGINSTFVTLIPNVDCPRSFKEFRPISMVGWVYKLKRARELNIIVGARIGSNGANGIAVSHLQFADDTIIFCKNDREELANIKRILRCFQLKSGLKINFSKSSLCGIKVNHQIVTSLARIMGCKVDHLPIKYLGLSLGANPNRIKTWDPVVERMEKRLSVWRRRFNTTGGRLTLTNSSLSSLPIYFLSIFKMPVSVAKVIEKIQR